ncbi:MAG: hypothetical protein K0R73_1 [Candidatus Midichloriaceae bacterium]|nr:hypothetical protein [Candidatus Midichloriaceae bacterium]
MREKADLLEAKYKKKLENITLSELKQFLKEELTPRGTGSKGLTILELAHFMKDIGCEFALNLDGGGSSTLWLSGKVVNESIGDKDEGNGFNIIRPVSDAIIFKAHAIH